MLFDRLALDGIEALEVKYTSKVDSVTNNSRKVRSPSCDPSVTFHANICKIRADE